MGVYKDLLPSAAGLKWPLEELQFLALPYWLHCPTPGVDTCFGLVVLHCGLYDGSLDIVYNT